MELSLTLAPGLARYTWAASEPLDAEARLELHERVLGLLGLHLEPGRGLARVRRVLAEHGEDRGQASVSPDVRLCQTGDVMDALLWAVLGQQVTLARTFALRRRLTERYGVQLPGGLWLAPSAQVLAALEPAALTALGLTLARAGTLIRVAAAVVAGQVPLDARQRGWSVQHLQRALLSVRGLGPWSVPYVLMRGFGFADCVPVGDSGLGEALRRVFALPARPGPADTLRLMARFAPARSLATAALWHTLRPSQEGPL